MAIGNPSFDAFNSPTSTMSCVRSAADLCDKEIAPYAADVDEKARYTDEALAAADVSGFAAVHIPEEYGARAATSVAACIVIEEVARLCASSSLIPICNKLGTMGLLMRGSEELKKQVLPTIAAGEAVGVVRAVRARGRQRRRVDADPRRQEGDEWVSTAPSAGSPTAATRPGTR